MANYSETRYVDRIAGAALTAATDNFRIVKMQADATNPTGRSVIKSTAATDKHFGVLNLAGDVKTGEPVDVCVRNAVGTFKVVLGGTVAVNDELTSDANGAAITTTTGGDQVIGLAQEAGVVGQVIEYLPVNRKYGN